MAKIGSIANFHNKLSICPSDRLRMFDGVRIGLTLSLVCRASLLEMDLKITQTREKISR